MPACFNWNEIDTVLLDMDGTLIDLAFDSHFWLQQVPEALSEKRGISLDAARELIFQEYRAVQHTMNWYWADQLDLDIYQMTRDAGPRAKMRDDCRPFLDSLRESGRQAILLTNAHPYSLEVKVKHTGLDQHLDLLLSTHTFGYPKEDQRLWQAVQQQLNFNPQRTLFVDDSEIILDAAKTFGIHYCLGIENPDSTVGNKSFNRHESISDYRTLLPFLDPTFSNPIISECN
jgi:HAD superfamily hydrolase (TIGR01509 family)